MCFFPLDRHNTELCLRIEVNGFVVSMALMLWTPLSTKSQQAEGAA